MTPIPLKFPDLPPLDLLEHPAAAAWAWRVVYMEMLITRRQEAALEVWRACRPAPSFVPWPEQEPPPSSTRLTKE